MQTKTVLGYKIGDKVRNLFPAVGANHHDEEMRFPAGSVGMVMDVEEDRGLVHVAFGDMFDEDFATNDDKVSIVNSFDKDDIHMIEKV